VRNLLKAIKDEFHSYEIAHANQALVAQGVTDPS
jgi:hypothetical protein